MFDQTEDRKKKKKTALQTEELQTEELQTEDRYALQTEERTEDSVKLDGGDAELSAKLDGDEQDNDIRQLSAEDNLKAKDNDRRQLSTEDNLKAKDKLVASNLSEEERHKKRVTQQQRRRVPLFVAISIQSVHTFTGVPRLEDEFLSSFIRRRIRLDKTVIIVHSDHGRISGGSAEHIMSSYMMSIPKSIFEKDSKNHQPGLLERLRRNEKQLYSHYDAWLTFRQIPFLTSPSPIFNSILQFGKSSPILSPKQRQTNKNIAGVFMELPSQIYNLGRSCNAAQIDPSLCLCVTWNSMDRDSNQATQLGNISIAYLNRLLGGVLNNPCREVKLKRVLEYEASKSFAHIEVVTKSEGRVSGPPECTWDVTFKWKKARRKIRRTLGEDMTKKTRKSSFVTSFGMTKSKSTRLLLGDTKESDKSLYYDHEDETLSSEDDESLTKSRLLQRSRAQKTNRGVGLQTRSRPKVVGFQTRSRPNNSRQVMGQGPGQWVVEEARRISPMTDKEDSLEDSVFSKYGLPYDTKNYCLV